MFEIIRVTGEAITPYLEEIAKLRIQVFREFPYLYEGNEAYEKEYLTHYAQSRDSMMVLAIKDHRIIGISTGLPLVDADPVFQQPFIHAGYNLKEIFYFGESVIEKAERGQGIGHCFFDERESHAADLGFSITTFCVVERPKNHPLRPDAYRSNDGFWQRRGYQKRDDLHAKLDWQQIDHPNGMETRNQLVFWLKHRY